MSVYSDVQNKLAKNPKTWLVTGCAGFIGSNIVEKLLTLNQKVIGIDNFSTGKKSNIEHIKNCVPENTHLFNFVEMDILDLDQLLKVTKDVDYISHQAALGSVPRSIKDPMATNENNVSGTLNVLFAAKENNVKNVVFASSSSVYGDDPELPKVEHKRGTPLSPYAVSKLTTEKYADVFSKTYNQNFIGIRYFNVFGKRQRQDGPYAAVIPKWFDAFINGKEVVIYGDGSTSRDFCYIDNVTQMNILAATTENPRALNQIYNCACNRTTSLTELFFLIKQELGSLETQSEPIYQDFRPGDIKDSLANIDKAQSLLGYTPTFYIEEGIKESKDWYLNQDD